MELILTKKGSLGFPSSLEIHLEIVPVKWIDRVLEVALEAAPQPLPEEEAAKPAEATKAAGGAGDVVATTH